MEQRGNKIIIIGSGLGGLACGQILARAGYDITILEQQRQPGGCLQCFTRGGVKFETGMHFIGSADRNQLLGKLFRYLDVYEKLSLQRLDTGGYDMIMLGDETYSFVNGYDNMVEHLAADFPAERDNLAEFFRLVHDVANASALHRLSTTDQDFVLTTRYQMESINDVVERYISDPKLRKVLVGNLPLYAAERDKTPFATYAFIMDFYVNSAYRFVDGSDQLTFALTGEIEKHGGRLLTGKKVTHIVCDETHATGVETADGDFYAADYVISTTHPARTIEMLRDTRLIRRAYRERVSALPNSPGAFSVYLKFKPGTVPYLNANVYDYPGGDPWGCEDYDDETWPKGYLYMHFCKDDTGCARTGVLLSYMLMDDVKQWADTTVGRRGADYEAFKRTKAEKLIDCLSARYPGIRDCIETYYTSTPLTYRDYNGAEDGGMYGIAKDINLGAAGRITHVTKIPNLLLSGQNINSHGILGVIVGAIVTCSEFIDAEEIFGTMRQMK